MSSTTQVMTVAAVFAMMFTMQAAHAASPLSQFNSGTAIEEIMCPDGRVLLESPRGTPACVKEASVDALVDRGFVMVDVSDRESMEMEEMEMMETEEMEMMETEEMEVMETEEMEMMETEEMEVMETEEMEMMETEEMEVMDGMEDAEGLMGEIDIGSLLPLTGRLSGHGQENFKGTEFGVIKFNEYLEEIGEPWSFNLISEDTETRETTALEKLQSLNARGVKIVLGPETSSNTKHVKPYADSNGMLLVSCCSTAPDLAIEGDNVYRLIPDDSNQGPALAAVMWDAGIERIIGVWRGDAYGVGLQKTTTEAFEELGGTVEEGIEYDPDTNVFSVEISLLAKNVQRMINESGAERVGVFFAGFNEITSVSQAANGHETLSSVRWFGADGTSKEKGLIEDPLALEFSHKVEYTALQVATAENPTYLSVQEYVMSELGRSPTTFAHSSYDSVWLVGMAMLETEGTDVEEIKAVLPDVAGDLDDAALGEIALNAAGDLDGGDYEMLGVRDGAWVSVGIYNADEGTVTIN
ncbi:MAG: ABC transporter substrate-binding protein [Nitrosopumilus sp.]|nr:ABC transporter substrate-binding protein [Nitrosopumilus sp.]